jgi:exosortase/archaeosortase family protein
MVSFQVLWESNEAAITVWPPLALISDWIGNFLLRITPAILNPLLRIDILREGNSLVLADGFYVSYWFHFSGLKQILLVICLFLFIPGAWLRKLWFIPLNIAIILFLVILRFMVLTIHCTIYPEHFHLLQDILFGPLFYFEILMMWLIWIVYVAKRSTLNFRMAPTSGKKTG